MPRVGGDNLNRLARALGTRDVPMDADVYGVQQGFTAVNKPVEVVWGGSSPTLPHRIGSVRNFQQLWPQYRGGTPDQEAYTQRTGARAGRTLRYGEAGAGAPDVAPSYAPRSNGAGGVTAVAPKRPILTLTPPATRDAPWLRTTKKAEMVHPLPERDPSANFYTSQRQTRIDALREKTAAKKDDAMGWIFGLLAAGAVLWMGTR